MEKRAPPSTAVKCGTDMYERPRTFRFVLFVDPSYNERKKKRASSSRKKEINHENFSISLSFSLLHSRRRDLEERKSERVKVVTSNSWKAGLKSRRNNFCVGGTQRFHGGSIRGTSFHDSLSF